MKIIYKVPGQHARELVVPNELAMLQELVGGYIESVTIDSDTVMLVNEEGVWLKLPYNCEAWGVPVVGPLIVCGYNEDDFTDCPISVEHFERIGCGMAVRG